jgi:hypothetical protein
MIKILSSLFLFFFLSPKKGKEELERKKKISYLDLVVVDIGKLVGRR